MEGVSIVVCCYNSELRIHETIKHLCALSRIQIPLEVIVVNNASTDNTSEVAQHAWNEYYRSEDGKIQFEIINEYTPGLTAARKRGVDHARYSYLLFVDDDNWLSPSFVTTVIDLMKAYPNAAVIGGEGIPYFENQVAPDWFELYKNAYAVGKQNDRDGVINKKRGYVYGAAVCWRLDILKRIFNQPLLLTDRLGDKLTSGGDVELCYNATLLGYDVVYSSALTFQHFIPQSRLNLDYLYRMRSDSVRGLLLLHGYLYKLGTHEHTFNSALKRTWWGQVAYRLSFLLMGKGYSGIWMEIKELIKLNAAYTRIFDQ